MCASHSTCVHLHTRLIYDQRNGSLSSQSLKGTVLSAVADNLGAHGIVVAFAEQRVVSLGITVLLLVHSALEQESAMQIM